jgi:hypothetical protein
MSSLEATAVLAPNHELMLQLATDDEVHAFDLSQTFRVALGRHPSNDVQLRSRRVSSYHAEILSEVEGLFVRDLASTNGTYVNDEPVRRKKLASGDRVRIGGFTLVVHLVPRSGEEKNAPSHPESLAAGTVGSLVSFRERSEPPDATLPELLTGLGRLARSAVVRIRAQTEEGKIHLRDGEVIHCECGAVRRQKALYRLLALERGAFEIEEPPPADSVPRTIHASTDDLLAEGMQQVEALDKLAAKLLPIGGEVVLNADCSLPVSTLTADEIQIYQELIRCRTSVRILDESEMTDFMVLLLIHGLLQKGFFRTANRTESPLEPTLVNRPQSG